MVSREAAVDHHFALSTLFEIMDVAARADLKSDLLKELDPPPHPTAELTGATRASPSRRWTPSSSAWTTPFNGPEPVAGQGRPVVVHQRMADGHPQSHQHPRRHLRF